MHRRHGQELLDGAPLPIGQRMVEQQDIVQQRGLGDRLPDQGLD